MSPRARHGGSAALLASLWCLAGPLPAQAESAPLSAEVDAFLAAEPFDPARAAALLERCRRVVREHEVEAAFHWRPATLGLRLAQAGAGLGHSEWRALLLESAAAAAKIGSAPHEEELRLAIADALLLGNAGDDAAAVLAPLAGASGLRDPVAVQTLLAVALDDQDEIVASHAALERARAAAAGRSGPGAAADEDLVHRVAATLALASGDPIAAQREFSRLREVSPAEAEQHELAVALATEDFASARATAERLARLAPDLAHAASFHGIQARRRLGEDPAQLDLELAALELVAPRALARFVGIERASLAIDRHEHARAADWLAALAPDFAAGPLRSRPLDLAWATTRARLELGRRGASAEDRAALGTVRAELDAVWSSLRRRWLAMPLRQDGLAFLQFGQRRDVAGLLIALDLRLDGPRVALRRVLEMEAQDSLVRALWQDLAVDVDAVARIVPADGGLLMFLGAPSGSHVFAWSAAGLEHAALEPDPALFREAREQSLALAETGTSAAQLRARGAALRDRLLPPAIRERLATWRELAIVGGEWVGSPAFEAFELDGEWWGCRFAMAHYPSLTGAVALARAVPQVRREPRLAVFVADRPMAELAERAGLRGFEGAEDFVLALQRGLGDERLASATGAEATSRRLTDLAADCSVLVLAGHGLRAARNASGFGLVLADRLWSSTDAAAAPLPPLLLGLSCRAAAGLRRGESFAPHFGGALIQAGVRSFLLAEFDLAVAPSFEITKELLVGLHAHHGRLAHALRDARRQLLAEGTRAAVHDVLALRAMANGLEPLPCPAFLPNDESMGPGSAAWAIVIVGAVLALSWLAVARLASRHASRR